MWQKCPVCEGRGIVRGGFYDLSSISLTNGTLTEPCRTCKGRGIIEQPQAVPVVVPTQWPVDQDRTGTTTPMPEPVWWTVTGGEPGPDYVNVSPI